MLPINFSRRQENSNLGVLVVAQESSFLTLCPSVHLHGIHVNRNDELVCEDEAQAMDNVVS